MTVWHLITVADHEAAMQEPTLGDVLEYYLDEVFDDLDSPSLIIYCHDHMWRADCLDGTRLILRYTKDSLEPADLTFGPS